MYRFVDTVVLMVHGALRASTAGYDIPAEFWW